MFSYISLTALRQLGVLWIMPSLLFILNIQIMKGSNTKCNKNKNELCFFNKLSDYASSCSWDREEEHLYKMQSKFI